MYSNNLPQSGGDNTTYTQVIEWHKYVVYGIGRF